MIFVSLTVLRARTKARVTELEQEVAQLNKALEVAKKEISALKTRETQWQQIIETVQSSVRSLNEMHAPPDGSDASCSGTSDSDPQYEDILPVDNNPACSISTFDDTLSSKALRLDSSAMPVAAYPPSTNLNSDIDRLHLGPNGIDPAFRLPMDQIELFNVMDTDRGTRALLLAV